MMKMLIVSFPQSILDEMKNIGRLEDFIVLLRAIANGYLGDTYTTDAQYLLFHNI